MSSLIIGVDVGGTNTDSVLLDLQATNSENRGVLAWNKTETTAEVSSGISAAISGLFDKVTDIERSSVSAVIIGTTHFINAIVERDQNRLCKVAVLRLCTEYSKSIPPYTNIPPSLERLMNGYVGFLKGGFHVDGEVISPVDPEEIRSHCKKISDLGIKSIVVGGIFANLDPQNELDAHDIIRECIPDADIILSHEVSGIGFLERENASILNASIAPFAKHTIASFQRAVRDFGLQCPVLLTQNDGTVLTASEAMKVPIKTFSSGPTNSMRGAAFLCRDEPDVIGKSAIVVDIGGTTSDAGELMENGFPRLCSSYSEIGGVRMNFSMPSVESIGLGGGSIIRVHDDHEERVTVGPDSLGTKITSEGLLYGGSTATASDITVASQITKEWGAHMGNLSLVENKFESRVIRMAQSAMKKMLEELVDKIKTHADDVPVILVGGGSFIAPSELEGVSKVIRVPYYHVANAIGAAIGKISTTLNEIKTIVSGTDDRDAIINEVIARAKKQSVEKGCVASTVEIADLLVDKVSYTANSFQICVKVVGDVDYKKIGQVYSTTFVPEPVQEAASTKNFDKSSLYYELDKGAVEKIDVTKYKPTINSKREWIVSEVDLDFITIGTYILGAGGGGHPYPEYLEVRRQLQNGATIRIIDPDNLQQHIKGPGSIVSCGFAGSPTVSAEQMPGSELMNAYAILKQYTNQDVDGVISMEIGGGNGLVSLFLASSNNINAPVVDCDFMGRAYPTGWQIIPYVYNASHCLVPCAVSDGNGNDLLISRARDERKVEEIVRDFVSNVGASVGSVVSPMTSTFVQNYTVKRSHSLAWRIGLAIRSCRQNNDIDNMPKYIIDAFGGPATSKEIFSGKIIDVQRSLFHGHVYGEVIIRNNESGQKMSVCFKNENIAAELLHADGTRTTVATVPDLISIVDTDLGEGVGTPEYRYGLNVFVLAIAPSNKWTDTPRGIEIGGPKAFGMDHFVYEPIGTYVEPRSVIEEYFQPGSNLA